MKTIITTALICISLQGLSQSTDPYQKVDLKLPETNKQEILGLSRVLMFAGAFVTATTTFAMDNNFDKGSRNAVIFASGMAVHATGMVIYINSRK
jgi:hypothetical protein